VLLYDGACGVCMRIARRFAGSVEIAPVQGARGEHLLRHLTPAERLASMHLALPDGRMRSGGDAIAPLLRATRLAPLAPLAAAVPALTRSLYDLAARHRALLGRVV
jgi:predicted DCC family thiol-disulfide oxidoreductase YuxK